MGRVMVYSQGGEAARGELFVKLRVRVGAEV